MMIEENGVNYCMNYCLNNTFLYIWLMPLMHTCYAQRSHVVPSVNWAKNCNEIQLSLEPF